MSINRNQAVDSLRAIAALTVLACHVWLGTKWWMGPFGVLGTAAVILFFLISGYCITLSLNIPSNNPIKHFLIRRFFRLYPVYWIAVILAALLIPTHVSMKMLVVNFTMFQRALGTPDVNGVFWSLFLELLFYVTIIAVMLADKSLRGITFLRIQATLITTALIFVIIRKISGIPLPYGHFMFLSVFFLGAAYAGYFDNHKIRRSYLYVYVALNLMFIDIIATLMGVPGQEAAYSHHFYNYLWPYLLFFTVLEKQWLQWHWLSYIGNISYCIYLLHMPILWICHQWLSNVYLLFITASVFTLLLSTYVHRYVESPCIAYGKSLVKNLVLKTRVLYGDGYAVDGHIESTERTDKVKNKPVEERL